MELCVIEVVGVHRSPRPRDPLRRCSCSRFTVFSIFECIQVPEFGPHKTVAFYGVHLQMNETLSLTYRQAGSVVDMQNERYKNRR